MNCSTLDCGLLDSILGDGKRFGGKAPVCKKIPAFVLFLIIWLAVIITMSKPLQYDVDLPDDYVFTQVGNYSNFSTNYFAGAGMNWIPSATLAINRRLEVFEDCQTACNLTANCTAFRVDSETSTLESCYLWLKATIPALTNPSIATTCIYGCTTYFKTRTMPVVIEYDEGPDDIPYTSPFAAGNLGCSTPLYYGVHLGMIMVSVGCVVYWLFFTLTVRSGRLLRLIFFATCVGLIATGGVTTSWVTSGSCCQRSRYSYSYSYYGSICTPPQKVLTDSALGVGITMILMGAFPALFLPWFFFHVIVWAIISGLLSFILQADFEAVWTYSAFARWLIWQDHEIKASNAKQQGGQQAANVIQHENNAQAITHATITTRNAGIQLQHIDPQNMLDALALREQLVREQATVRELRDEIAQLKARSGGGSDELLGREQAVSAGLRQEVARLRQEIAVLQLQQRPLSFPNYVPVPEPISGSPSPEPEGSQRPQFTPLPHPFAAPQPQYAQSQYGMPAQYGGDPSYVTPPTYDMQYDQPYHADNPNKF